MDDESRAKTLAALQARKMARSPHAFVRGATLDHYAWLQELHETIPEGPPIWICGDCHIGNLGPIADKEGGVDIQIRDLDQTVIGNPAHDLIRLALSLASAARGSNLPGVTTADMIERMVEGYEAGLLALDDESPVAEPPLIATIKRRAFGRKWRHLARERIRDVKPSIPKGEKLWALDEATRARISELLDAPAVASLILGSVPESAPRSVTLIDAAFWVKGCSSLGKLRYAALARIGGRRQGRHALIDVKEAVEPAPPPAPGVDMPTHHGERVVTGARALSPNLGERMAPATFAGRPVFVRELMPEDLKLDIDQLTRKEAVTSARYLASVIGKAHGRQMSPNERRAWLRELTERHPPDFAAPTWLWNAVAALLVRHEGAYLAHCRRLLSAA